MTYQIEKRFLMIKQNPLVESRIIIAHESGNTVNTGIHSLENEVSFMTKQALAGGAFVSHWVGNGGQIIQMSKTGFAQYGAGANANPYAYAQVELARTSNPSTFKKDYLAYVWLLKTLAKEANLPVTLNSGKSTKEKGIKTHHWVSSYLGGTNHSDPDHYLASFGISLSQFALDLANSPFQPTLTEEKYVVKFGDTLWSIAKENHTTVTWLKKLNQLSSDQINVGKVLILKVSPTEQLSVSKSSKEHEEVIRIIQKTSGTIIDGVFGPITKKALLCLFQEAIHTKVDGFWGPKTAALSRNIQLGTIGNDVYAVQSMLFGIGYDSIGIPDRIVGESTKQAILLFQKNNHLVCDGIVGKRTLTLLFQ